VGIRCSVDASVDERGNPAGTLPVLVSTALIVAAVATILCGAVPALVVLLNYYYYYLLVPLVRKPVVHSPWSAVTAVFLAAVAFVRRDA
jgi:hypothetical protein